MRKQTFIFLLIFATIIVTASFIYNTTITRNYNKQIVVEMMKFLYHQVVNTRAWNSMHNGVYVNITPHTQPNPYLKDSLRDITTTSGMKLTKLNPAYMIRQIAEFDTSKNEITIHLTSLKPIRPENKADDWESSALKKFENGEKEVFEIIKKDTVVQYRFMAPLIVDATCMKCHSHQGYKINDIRGGLSLKTNGSRFNESQEENFTRQLIFHIIILIMGYIGIVLFNIYSKSKVQLITEKNERLEKEAIERIKAEDEIQNLLQYITESKEELAIKADMLNDLNNTKDKFFSIIAHDLRNPIGNFKLVADLLAKEYKNMADEEKDEFMNELRKSAENLYALLENLLVWSRSQRGKIDFNPAEELLMNLTVKSIDIVTTMAANKDIKLINDVNPDTKIFADLNMLDTVIRNLLSNSIKFTNRGGFVKISSSEDEKTTAILIEDNGIGMTEETITKLFRLDAKIGSPGTEGEPTTGLGLILCKEFIDRHKGTIKVESKLWNGSKFSITLPKNQNIAE